MRKKGPGAAPQGLENLASPGGRKVRCDKLREFVSPLGQSRTSLLPASQSNRAMRRRQTSLKKDVGAATMEKSPAFVNAKETRELLHV